MTIRQDDPNRVYVWDAGDVTLEESAPAGNAPPELALAIAKATAEGDEAAVADLTKLARGLAAWDAPPPQ